MHQSAEKRRPKGRLFLFLPHAASYQVSVLWQPLSPPELGLQVLPLNRMAFTVVDEAVAAEIGAVSDVKCTAASLVVSWQTVQASFGRGRLLGSQT